MADESDSAQAVDAAALEQYVRTLFPLQQQTIATAQLAGCRFERRRYDRFAGVAGGARGAPWSRWITTTQYEVFLPDGTSAGTAEDIYECALIALSVLDTPSAEEQLTASRLRPDPVEMFQLLPDNEPATRAPDPPWLKKR